MKKSLLFLLLFAVNSCTKPSEQLTYTPKFVEEENTLFDIREDQVYTFGYLEVPENRSNHTSRTIRLPVFIFKSRSENPKPDPIIYTVGGPGSSTMPSAPYMNYYQYLDDRDFILFEQRGTRYAQPHLDCPEWAEAVHMSNLNQHDYQKSDSLFQRAAQACRDRLTSDGIDLNGYRTTESAADIADLAKVLNLLEYNLLTISYSTKIAQVLMRDYPAGIRSVVMDSPLPLEVQYDEESVGNLLETIDKLLLDCEADQMCASAYPDLKDRFMKYLEEISIRPLEVIVENPETGDDEIFLLRGKDLLTVFTSASTDDVPTIPVEIEKVLQGDLTSVKGELQSLFGGPGSGSGQGMRLSVWCAEETPFNSREIISEETNRYPATAGLSPAVFSEGVCDIWNVEKVNERENEPVKSNIPVLLISGGYDNETPPDWAAAMQSNMFNSHHVIFQGWKHTPTTNWSNQCAMKLANAFFNEPGRRPDMECYTNLGQVHFKTD